jgi:hypothetical protein
MHRNQIYKYTLRSILHAHIVCRLLLYTNRLLYESSVIKRLFYLQIYSVCYQNGIVVAIKIDFVSIKRTFIIQFRTNVISPLANVFLFYINHSITCKIHNCMLPNCTLGSYTINNKLTWKPHINEVVKKVNKRLYFLSNLNVQMFHVKTWPPFIHHMLDLSWTMPSLLKRSEKRAVAIIKPEENYSDTLNLLGSWYSIFERPPRTSL